MMFRRITALSLLMLLPWFGTPKGVLAESSEAQPGVQPSFIPVRSTVSFGVRDFQPEIDRTGPMNWIARNPRDAQEVFASSVTGGLWRSRNGGDDWGPIRSLQPWSVSAVAYLFDGTKDGAILVTTREDFRRDSGAGVWRSNDHGDSWTRLAQVPTGCDDVPRAHGIAVRNTIVYVATSCGLLRSKDGRTFAKVPASEFSPSGVFPDTNAEHFYSVEFTQSGDLLAGGEAGFFWNMHRASGSSGSVLGMNGDNGEMRRAFAPTSSAMYPNYVLALSGGQGNHTMMISPDSGRTWSQVPSSPRESVEGAGGSPFVRIIPTSPGFDDFYVFYGNSLGWYRAGPFAHGDLSRLVGTVIWTQLTIGHPDPHDVDFRSLPGEGRERRVMFLATDGGLEVCNFGSSPVDMPTCHERQVFGTNRGLSPIQVMNVKGQIIGSGESAVRRLYMNTWHTDAWALPEDGRPWIREGGETAWLEMERHIENVTDAQIIYNNNALPNMLGRDLRADAVDFVDAPNVQSPPVLLKRGIFSETSTTEDTTSLFAAANVTIETMPRIGWIPFTRFETCSAPRDCTPLSMHWASVFAGYLNPDRTNAVLYQPYWDRLAVVNLTFSRDGSRVRAADVSYPHMRWGGNDVKLGITWTPFTGFGATPVFGIDPSLLSHVLAADTNNGKVMRSTDGGDTWNPINELSEVVVKDPRDGPSGREIFQFRIWRGAGFQSLVSSISFFPEDPNLVMIGTVENGLFFSQDRGVTWQHVPNTEHITNVVALYWRSANSVIVGSWGRGLFEITMRYRLPRSFFDSMCGGCVSKPVLPGLAMTDVPRLVPIVAQSGSDFAQSNFDEALLVLDGRINGVELKQGQVGKFWRTVGSSEYRFGSPNSKLAFETEEHTGFMGFKDLPVADQLRSQGQVVKGLGFTNGRLTHVIYGSQQTPIPAPTPLGPVSFSKETNPRLKEAYLRIFGPGMVLGTIAGKEPFVLQGYLFPANMPLELLVDGEVKTQLRTDATGRFATRLDAPTSIGPHVIVVRQSIGNRTVQAAIGFSVNNSDSK